MTAHPLTDALVARHTAETKGLSESTHPRNLLREHALRQVSELLAHARRMEEALHAARACVVRDDLVAATAVIDAALARLVERKS